MGHLEYGRYPEMMRRESLGGVLQKMLSITIFGSRGLKDLIASSSCAARCADLHGPYLLWLSTPAPRWTRGRVSSVCDAFPRLSEFSCFFRRCAAGCIVCGLLRELRT